MTAEAFGLSACMAVDRIIKEAQERSEERTRERKAKSPNAKGLSEKELAKWHKGIEAAIAGKVGCRKLYP